MTTTTQNVDYDYLAATVAALFGTTPEHIAQEQGIGRFKWAMLQPLAACENEHQRAGWWAQRDDEADAWQAEQQAEVDEAQSGHCDWRWA